MAGMKNGDTEQADTYDEVARSTGWEGPSVVFALLSPSVMKGQTVLDIGIGTGLGSESLAQAGLLVTGIDVSESMLALCRKKGFATLIRHDLTVMPYPFRSESFDYVISTGVFQFFASLDRIFGEIARVLIEGGRFAFVTGERLQNEPAEVIAGPEQTGTEESITMYRHTSDEVSRWLENSGMQLLASQPFSVWMDEGHTKLLPMRAYLAERP